MVNWQDIVLYFADGSGLTSRWDRTRHLAIEHASDGAETLSSLVTDEHLRALSELHDGGSIANWFTDERLTGDGPGRDDIDWEGMPAFCPCCGHLVPDWDMRRVPEAQRELVGYFEAVCRSCAWRALEAAQPGRPGHILEPRAESGGWRHYLGEQPVACGTSLELWLGDDRWVLGRYECSLGVERPQPRLVLYASCDEPSDEVRDFARAVLETEPSTVAPVGELLLSEDARFRWPQGA